MATNVMPRDAAATLPSPSDADHVAIDARGIATTIGRVTVSLYREPEDLRERWQAFEREQASTCYQTYRWCETFTRTVARPKNIEVVFALGENDKRDVLFILPFEICTIGGLRVLRWLGVDHANYNFAPIRREAAEGITQADVSALLSTIADQTGDIAAAILKNQPFDWSGIANPLARLPYRPSANAGFAASLNVDFDELFQERVGSRTRSSMRRKEKRLRSIGSLETGFCDNTSASRELLETYFEQKAKRFADMGIGDIFADPCHQDFYRDLASGDAAEGRLEMAYLRVGETISATLGAIHHRGRTNMLLLSITDDESARWSPGLILIGEAIREACAKQFDVYDFGLGGGTHKEMWCDQRIELFDNFVAFSARGLLVTLPMAAKASLKRLVKSNSMLWALANRARRLLKGRA